MAVLDHLVYAVDDLDEGRRWFAQRIGVRPAFGGSHPGRGTHNALVSVGSAYVELIAADPGQPNPAGPLPFGLDGVAGAGLVAFAVRPDASDSIDDLVRRARAAGYDPGDVVAMSRRRPDGSEIHWRLTFPPTTGDGAIPFVIDWGATSPPSATAPGGVELVAFEVAHPDRDSVRAAHVALGVEVTVRSAGAAGLTATLHGPAGEVTLEIAPRTGA